MDTFELLLDSLSPIDENGIASITGSIVGLGVLGSDVSLSIDFGDLSAPTSAQLFTVSDDGTGADRVANDGVIEFGIPNLYFDDAPSDTSFDVYDISVEATEQVLSGTDAVFVVDISGSTANPSGIDVDGDGVVETGFFNNGDSILAAEIAAVKALNQDLISRGLGDISKVSLAVYEDDGSLVDLDPITAGIQTFTTPNADADNNGILDIDQALDALQPRFSTNFQAGLQQAISAVNAAGTAPSQGSVVFLSDGARNFGSSGAIETDTIVNTLGQNLRAFGVGPNSELGDLQVLDPNAEKFTDIQELLDLFSGVGSNINRDSDSTTIRINNVAPDVELGQPSDIDENSTLTLTGMFTDPGTLDTYTATVDWGDRTSADFALSAISELSVGDSLLSASDGSELSVTAVNAATGEVSFSVEHSYVEAGSVTISASISDDDSGTDTDTIQLSVLPVGDTNQAPVAVNDLFNSGENVAINGNVLGNDSDPDGDPLAVAALTDVSNGVLELEADGSFTYTPDAGFGGDDSFTYEVSDGNGGTDQATVTFRVAQANGAPDAVADSANTTENTAVNIAVLANDSDPNGDTLSLGAVGSASNGSVVANSNGTVTYTPDAGFSGVDSFTYVVSDGDLTDTATVEVTVEADVVNPPEANPVISVEKLVDANGDSTFSSQETLTQSAATFQIEITNTGAVDVTLSGIVDSTAAAPELALLVGTTLIPGASVVATYETPLLASSATILGTSSADILRGKQTETVNTVTVSGSNASGSATTATSMASVLVAANNLIAGDLGEDTIFGGSGNDVLRGDLNLRSSQVGIGNDDIIYGGAGRDRIGGKGGNDTLFGGDGDDRIWGDDGDDLIRGGRGNDILTGDDFSGGQGADTFVLADGEGTDTIVDFEIDRDFIGLADGLTLGALSFANNTISLGEQTLAILTGVDTTTLTADRFVTVSDSGLA